MKFEFSFTNSDAMRSFLIAQFNVPAELVDAFVLDLHSGECWIENNSIVRYIDDGHMPFDKWDGKNGLSHATGREYWDSYSQYWEYEYECDNYYGDSQSDAEFLRDFNIYMMDEDEEGEYDDEPPFNPCLDDDDEVYYNT